MAIGIAAGIAGAGLLGDLFASQGQQQTNVQNQQIAEEQMQFQGQQTQQVEQWEQAQASNAMQTRVADLQKAGLNPMLATNLGGAQAMSVSPPSGANIPMQNPNAAFGNAGQIASSAIGAYQAQNAQPSQIGLNNAQASAAQAQAVKNYIDANFTASAATDKVHQDIQESMTHQDLMVAQADANKAAAALDRQQVQESFARIDKINADIAALGHTNNLADAQAYLARLNGDMQDLNINQFTLIAPELVKQAIATSNSMQINAGMLAKAYQTYQGNFGTTGAYMDRIANWLHIGANISQSSSSGSYTRSYGQ